MNIKYILHGGLPHRPNPENNKFYKEAYAVPSSLIYFDNDNLVKILPEIEYIEEMELSEAFRNNITYIQETLKNKIFHGAADVKHYVENIMLSLVFRSDFVKDLVLKKYEITTDINDRVRFTTIFDEITKNIDLSSEQLKLIKKRLPNILSAELALEKKRYKDGIYWYGLKIIDPAHYFRKSPKNNVKTAIISAPPKHQYTPPTIDPSLYYEATTTSNIEETIVKIPVNVEGVEGEHAVDETVIEINESSDSMSDFELLDQIV